MHDAKKYVIGAIVGILVTVAVGWALNASPLGQGFIYSMQKKASIVTPLSLRLKVSPTIKVQ
ncbi:MAG: hypothetical protein WC806_05835 [Candidatus Gracilibacteria bacterium]|jgi:hypothetical protein